MNPPPFIDVEKQFGSFVKAFGGSLVSEIVGSSPRFANADYLFRDDAVIAELKCMEKDVLADHSFKTAIAKACERWIASRSIPAFWGTVQIDAAKLPAECQREFFQIVRKTVQGAIKKANIQIRETKAHFDIPKAKGLLLLVNDGCWSLQTDAMLYLTDISLGNQCSNINSVVYFTVNMPARMPGVERDVLVWIPAERTGVEPVNGNFLERMQQGWCAYHECLVGERVPIFEISGREHLPNIKFIRREDSVV